MSELSEYIKGLEESLGNAIGEVDRLQARVEALEGESAADAKARNFHAETAALLENNHD